jgi:hypothetical protein
MQHLEGQEVAHDLGRGAAQLAAELLEVVQVCLQRGVTMTHLDSVEDSTPTRTDGMAQGPVVSRSHTSSALHSIACHSDMFRRMTTDNCTLGDNAHLVQCITKDLDVHLVEILRCQCLRKVGRQWCVNLHATVGDLTVASRNLLGALYHAQTAGKGLEHIHICLQAVAANKV